MNTKHIISLFICITAFCIVTNAAGNQTLNLPYNTKKNFSCFGYADKGLMVNESAFVLHTPKKKIAIVNELKSKKTFVMRFTRKLKPGVKSIITHFSLKPVFDFLENGKLVHISGFKLKIKL